MLAYSKDEFFIILVSILKDSRVFPELNENYVNNLILPLLTHPLLNDRILKSVISDLINLSKGFKLDQVIVFLEGSLKSLNNELNIKNNPNSYVDLTKNNRVNNSNW